MYNLLNVTNRFGTIPLENPQLFYLQGGIAHVVSGEATFGRDNRIGCPAEGVP
jgi:hypothetical protein